jgi:hypothetical protein
MDRPGGVATLAANRRASLWTFPVADSATDSAPLRAANPLLALCTEAIQHHRSGRYVAAIKLYERILSLKPDLPDVFFLFGHGLAAMGKPEAAITAFQRSIALPNNSESLSNPVDTSMSSFATHFTQGYEHTYDLAELGRYHRSYQSLMTHWHNVLPPGRIMDVRYEELVADLEGVARRIVSRCGLAWDDRCLEFHQTERPIRTASAAQVRKPIYTNSVGRWRKFDAFLEPLFAELVPFTAGFRSAASIDRPAFRGRWCMSPLLARCDRYCSTSECRRSG